MIYRGAPWTRSSLSSFAQPGTVSASADASFAGGRAGEGAGQLPREQERARVAGQGARPQGYLMSGGQMQATGSILSFPSSIQRPNDAELKRAKKQELMDFYQLALREKAQRGKEDITLDPLKNRAAELSLQRQRERAFTRNAVSSSILTSEEPHSPMQQDYLAQVEETRKRKVAVTVQQRAGPSREFTENAALFYGENPSAASPKGSRKMPFAASQSNQRVRSFQENSSLFYGESNAQPVLPPSSYAKPAFSGTNQSSKSFEDNKAAFYGVDRGVGNSPSLGKTVPKSTVSDPITGQVRTVSSEKPRYSPLGGPKPDIFVGKINDSPAPQTRGNAQPSYTKKSGYRPSNYNPLTGQDQDYSPYRGARF